MSRHWRISVTLVVLAGTSLLWLGPLPPRWSVALPDFASAPLDDRRIVGFTGDHATLFTDCYPPDSDCYRLQRWSVRDGSDLGEITCPLQPALSRRVETALSPDGRFLAIAGLEKGMPDRPHIWLMSLSSGAGIGDFPAAEAWNVGHHNTFITFSPDSSWLALVDGRVPVNAGTDSVRLVSTADPTTGKSIPLSGRLDGFSLSPDGKTLAADVLDVTFDVKRQQGRRWCELIDVTTGQSRLRLEGERHASFLPDGSLVLSDGWPGRSLRRREVSPDGLSSSGREIRLADYFQEGRSLLGGLHMYEARPVASGVLVTRSGFRGPHLFYHIAWDTGVRTTRGEAAVHGLLEETFARERSLILQTAPSGSLAASLDDHGRVRVYDIATPRWRRAPGIMTGVLFAVGALLALDWWRMGRRKKGAITVSAEDQSV